MTDLLRFALVALSAVFFIVDPLAVVPLFLAMTAGDSDAKRRQMAARASLVAACLLTVFAVFGRFVFELLGISNGAFRAAGGLLLLVTAFDMLRARPSRTRSSPGEQQEGAAKEDVAIVPLAMPLLAGPGSIATVMVLVGRGEAWYYAIPVLGAIWLTCLASFLILSGAGRIDRALGRGGLAILERVMGLLLAAIAVQFIVDGVVELLPGHAAALS